MLLCMQELTNVWRTVVDVLNIAELRLHAQTQADWPKKVFLQLHHRAR